MSLFAMPSASPPGVGSPNIMDAKEEEEMRPLEGTVEFDPTLDELTLVPNLTISDNSSEVFSVNFSPDERFLAAACGDGAIRVFLANSGALAHTLSPGTNVSLPITGLQFRPLTPDTRTRNVLVSCNAGGLLQHWHVTSGKCLHQIELPDGNSVLALDFTPDASSFAIGCKDASVRVYDEATKTEVSALVSLPGFGSGSAPGHSNRVFSVKWHPEYQNCLISGGWDNTIQIWDTREGRSVRSIYGPHIAGDALDVTGNTILSAAFRLDDALQLWDFGTGRLIENVEWGQGTGNTQSKLYAASFSRGLQPRLFAAGGCDANEAKVFDLRRGNQLVGSISGLQRGIFALDFSPTSSRVAFAGGDCAIRIVDIVKASSVQRTVGTL